MSEDEHTDVDPAGEDPVEKTPTQSKKIEAIASIVPVHAVSLIKRKPGRPRKIHPQATTSDLEYHAEIAKQRTSFIEGNSVVKAVASRKDSMEVLQTAKEEAARTAAALLFQRTEEEKYGRDTSQISSRHLSALRDVAYLELEMKKMGATLIDFRSERFIKIFKYFIETVQSAAEEVLPPETVDLLMNKLETKLEDWEEQAQHL